MCFVKTTEQPQTAIPNEKETEQSFKFDQWLQQQPLNPQQLSMPDNLSQLFSFNQSLFAQPMQFQPFAEIPPISPSFEASDSFTTLVAQEQVIDQKPKRSHHAGKKALAGPKRLTVPYRSLSVEEKRARVIKKFISSYS